MKKLKLALLVALLLTALVAHAANESTIDPTVPAQDSDLSSDVIRNNFLAAYNDINLLNTLLGPKVLSANQILGALTNGPAQGLLIPQCDGPSQAVSWTPGTGWGCTNIVANQTSGPAGGDLAGTYPNPTLANTPAARTNLGLGSAAVANIGTSGSTVPVLSASNTFSGTNNFTGTLQINGAPTAPSAIVDTTNAGNISAGTLANARLAPLVGNQLFGALVTGAPGGLFVPTCSGASNALIWTSGVGFGCNTITAGGGGGPPTGAAGGDLGSTYPNPTVTSIANVTTGTLPITRGGTGAVTAATALSNLNGTPFYANRRQPRSTDDAASGYSIGQFWQYGKDFWYSIATTAGFANWQIQTSVSAKLCDLAPTCKAAFGAVKLVDGWAGNAFEITRVSDSTTKLIGFDSNGVAKWGDVDAFCLGTGCGIDTLYDQTGNGCDLTQATYANMPKILGWSVGNLRAISFTGVLGSATTLTNTTCAFANIQNTSILAIQRPSSSGGINGNPLYEEGYPSLGLSIGASQGPDFRGVVLFGNSQLFSVQQMLQTNDSVMLMVDSAGHATLDQNNKHSAYSGTVTSRIATGLRVGSSSVNSNVGRGELAALLYYDAALSATSQQTIKQAAYQLSGITPQAIDNLLYVGDSITEGSTGNYGQDYAMQLTRLMPHPLNFFNVGFYGRTLAQMVPDASTFAPLAYTAGALNVVTIFAGTNDLATSSAITAASVYANMQTICGTYKATGYKCVIVSPLCRNGLFSGGSDATNFESRRQTLVGLMAAGWPSFADGFMDLANDPVMGPQAACSNATLYGDGVHPTAPLGYSYVAAAFARGLKSIIQ